MKLPLRGRQVDDLAVVVAEVVAGEVAAAVIFMQNSVSLSNHSVHGAVIKHLLV